MASSFPSPVRWLGYSPPPTSTLPALSRLLARIQRAQLEIEQARIVAEALTQSSAPAGPRSAPADPRALRGIPVIGGCSGAIPGTTPHKTGLRRADRGTLG